MLVNARVGFSRMPTATETTFDATTFSGMTADRCAALAQVLPVFLLAFIIEVRVLDPGRHRKGTYVGAKVLYTTAVLYLSVIELALVGAAVADTSLENGWRAWIWGAFAAGLVVIIHPVLRLTWTGDRHPR